MSLTLNLNRITWHRKCTPFLNHITEGVLRMSKNNSDNKRIKFHAFVRLKSALVGERYEECSEWILQALSHQAKKRDVLRIIKDPFLNLENMAI